MTAKIVGMAMAIIIPVVLLLLLLLLLLYNAVPNNPTVVF